MADIQVYKRVIDYVGLNAKPIPERSLVLFRELQPTLALLQAMGVDGASLLQVDTAGALKVALGVTGGPTTFVNLISSNGTSPPGITSADAQADNNLLWFAVRQFLYNGATSDKQRSASAANLAAQSGLGAALTTLPGQWSASSQPAAGSQATASKAAGGAGVRHICTSIDFSAIAAVAPAATVQVISLRDGASGAGTVLRIWLAFATAAIGSLVPPFGLSGLNVVGSANTAMTLEFAGALANLSQAVSFSGYSVS